MRGYSDLVEERDRLVAELSEVVHTFDEYSDVLVDCPGVQPIREIATELKATSDNLLEEGRLLKLGIVGQIKAGKSTLLNLLLFDGREVLPSAATPMTASLTHIVRSEEIGTDQAEVDVEYYSPDEWQEIEAHAREYLNAREAARSPGEFLTACHELVEMAEERGIEITDHTGTDTRPASIDDLNNLLRSVVGAEGELTPLVKSVTIRCGQGAPALEMVDTPGLNDPIVSRVRATHKLLAGCDAVLLLSYAGQFMDSSDVKLLQRTLPMEGIKRCLVIGSKFDSALVDVAPEHRHDLKAAADAVEEQLNGRFQREIERMRYEDDQISITPDDMHLMSSMCAILGTTPCSQWNAAERAVFATLCRSYPDWLDTPENGMMNEETAINLVDLMGRREEVDETMRVIRADRDEILRNKQTDFMRVRRGTVLSHCNKLNHYLSDRLETLRGLEIKEIDERRAATEQALRKVTDSVIEIWNGVIESKRETIAEICELVATEIKGARDVVEQSHETRTIEKSPGLLFIRKWWRELWHIPHRYEESVFRTVRLKIAFANMLDRLDQSIYNRFRNSFDHSFVTEVGAAVRKNVGNVLNDYTGIAVSFEGSLNRSIERIAKKARADIGKHRFPPVGEVDLHGEAEAKAEQALHYLTDIQQKTKTRVENALCIVDAVIPKGQVLVKEVTRNLRAYYGGLRKDVEERQLKLQRHERARNQLLQHCERLSGTGC